MLAIGVSAFLVALAVTFVVTPGVVRLAHRLGAVDLPGRRKLHTEPIPRIGGVAVFIGFVAGLGLAAGMTGALFEAVRTPIYWKGMAIAATGLFLLGLIDDLWQISFRWKLAAQVAAGLYIWTCGFRIEVVSSPAGGMIELGLLTIPVTVLWVVGITNAVNLIDGLDGLAAGTAVIMTGAVAVIAAFKGHLGVTAASVALAGSLIGFLWFNFNPARIFLGDSGSMFLGFVLAVTSVRGSQKGPTVVAVLVPLLVLGLPLLDAAFAVVRRAVHVGGDGLRSGSAFRYITRNGTKIFMPDQGHIHHRLLEFGLSHRNAVLTLYGVAVLMAAAAFALVLLDSVLVAALLVSVLALLLVAFLVLLYVRNRTAKLREQDPDATELHPELATDSSGGGLE